MVYLNKYYVAEKIAENTYKIDESGVANCYLLIGDEKALLIDTGCGAGNLKEAVEKLTNKPLFVAVTHRHPDHAGGAWQFGTYYMHKDDKKVLYGIMSHPLVSKRMLKIMGAERERKLRRKRYKIVVMEDGHRFELGNRSIIVKSVPGHTKGSVLFLDEKEKMMFTGDNTNFCLWMHLPGCTTLEEWLQSAKTILDYYDMGYKAYGGHSKGLQSKEETKRVYNCVKKVVEKNTIKENKLIDNQLPVILYRKRRVKKILRSK